MRTIRDSFAPEARETAPNVAPGAIDPLHPHDRPQQVLMLEGDAVDEIIDGEDDRREATCRKGSFVDYPPIMSHSTRGPGGSFLALGG